MKRRERVDNGSEISFFSALKLIKMGQKNDEHRNLLVLGIFFFFYIKNTNRNISIILWRKVVYVFY